MQHFGVTVRAGKYGFKLDRDTYAIINPKNSFSFKFESMVDYYTDSTGLYYTDDWCQKNREDCLENFDLNMKYCASLDHKIFNETLDIFLNKYKDFKQVFDLNDYEYISGCYIMVLDEFSQVYIGVSDNITKRIRQHWTKNKAFDRLLFPIGAVNTSVLSIDCFRCLDTTRIYVYKTKNTYELEKKFVHEFPSEFICNRIGGGIRGNGLLQFLEAKSTLNSRDM